MYTNVDTYIPKLKELYPDVKEKDLKRIVEYGWRMFYMSNVRGCDVLMSSTLNKFWIYSGDLTYDSVKHYHYYRAKLKRKIRYIYRKHKREWDGYYYTGLTEDEYNALIKSKNSVGKKKKNFQYEKKICYKLADEAKLAYPNSKCIIKFRYIIDMGIVFYTEKLKCQDVSIYLERDHPDKFEDILIYNYKYEQL